METTRLDVKDGKILNTAKNKEILKKDKFKQNLTKSEALDKLRNYRVIEDNADTSNKWHRFINITDGKLRGGGFIIKNNPSDPFIAFKNVSLGFTFSVQRDDVILFENKGQDSLSSDLEKLLKKYSNLSDSIKPNFILIPPPFETILSARTKAELTKEASLGKNTIRIALKQKRNKIRAGLIFQLTDEEKDLLSKDLSAVDPEGNTDRLEVRQIIDLFFS